MVGISHQNHHLTCVLQVYLGGRQRKLSSVVPGDQREERMGARRSSLVGPLAADRDEDGCKRVGSSRGLLQRDGGVVPTYGVGGGV